MATTSKQRLALAICDFLSTSLSDGTLQSEDKDSIDIAINCISETFGVDPTDKAAVTEALGSQNLLQIYSVYEKLKGAAPSAASAAASKSAPKSAAEPTEEQKKQAESLKSKGNAAMAQKDHAAAISFYTQALELNPNNAIYLSNRAAAHSGAGDHASAIADAEAAVAIDPKYTKGWSRLGLARFVLGNAKGAMEAYKQGMEHEGNGGSETMRKGYETAKRRVEELAAEEAASSPSPSARGAPGGGGGGLADLLGGGGPGGMDFASIMNNPMFSQMAQNLMGNPDLMSSLMNNPRLRQMADQFGNGNMPDIGSLMSDPNIAEMARNMAGSMGGAGAGRGAGGPGAPGGPGGAAP
ncbi:small glutamine-rich tetratricopeptide repeat-containing protein 2 [Echria macrotheca]|uniref:Small glutamine-rich tetratricopeptide repeat-containing protein 2 n=1 Tax=Echria macrotheca TaxID=438768 RepID=A0AAJ0BJ61_9PEZI|nr:small glutamine-rich tetratricopeptide repeat-containing protein 2 [Echria macrotheca]